MISRRHLPLAGLRRGDRLRPRHRRPARLPAEAARALEAAFAATFADPNCVRDAERVSLPLRPLVGREYRDMVLAEGKVVRAMFARRPWRR